MFSTLPRGRSFRRHTTTKQEQEEQKPEPGGDSTYGVRSIGDWGEGSEESRLSVSEADAQNPTEVEDVNVNVHGGGGGEDREEMMSPKPDHLEMESTPTNDRPRLPSPSPTSPILTSPHDLDIDQYLSTSTSTTSPGPRGRSRDRSPRSIYYPSGLGHLIYQDQDQDSELEIGLSEPSSPASFASMPSYISSNLSRTSSLAGEGRQIPTLGMGMGIGGSEELVMPTINIGHHPGQVGSRLGIKQLGVHDQGVRIILLGSQAVVDDFMVDLRRQAEAEVMDVGNGKYTLLKGNVVVGTLMIGLSGEEVDTRIEMAYTTLNGALHPDPSPEVQDHVLDLVAGYAAKSDWVHLVVALEGEASMVASLGELVPVLPAEDGMSPSRGDYDTDAPDPTSPIHSPSAAPDPTPMPGVEGLSYFPSHPPHPASASAHSQLAIRLLRALRSPEDVQKASTDKFLDWRSARRDLASSHASISHESSTGFYEAAMPTVARAQGGGEWEANLSRRLAKRRQSASGLSPESGDGAQAQAQGRDGKRRPRRSTVSKQKVPKHKDKEREACGPLFPSSAPRGSQFGATGKTSVGLGINELVEKTFGGLRRRWRWGIVAAAAVALVVGWNWDWSVNARAGPCM